MLVGLFFLFVLYTFFRRRTVPLRIIRFGIAGFIILFFLRVVFVAILTNRLWSRSSGVEKYWTIHYSNKVYLEAIGLMKSLGVSLAIGVVLLVILLHIQKRRAYLFSKEDAWLLVFGVLISGWPNFFIFLALVFFFTVFFKLFMVMARKEKISDRIIITPAIPVAVITTIFFGAQFAVWTGLHAIR